MRVFFLAMLMTAVGLGVVPGGQAQSDLPVYTDALVGGFQDWGWAAHDYASTSPVHGGTRAVRVTIGAPWEGLQIVRSAFDTSPYASLAFWIHGGTAGGQRLRVYGLAHLGGTVNTGLNSYSLPTLAAGTWQQITIPLSALGLANRTNATGFVFQDRAGVAQPAFHLDDIRYVATAPPALVQVAVDATRRLRLVDERHLGVNLAMWDRYFDPPDDATTVALLRELGVATVRMPGGSLSDEYHWQSNTTRTNTWQWAASFDDLARAATNAGAQAVVTVNYGSGTAEEAAAWVRYANLTRRLGFRYWEIGNECYGTWEYDVQARPHDPYTYAVRAAEYLARMKAVDPAIRVGVPAVPGEDAHDNGYRDHPAVNPRTGATHHGWTPVLLTTLKGLGVTPDFLVHHHYPQWTDGNNPAASPDDDRTLLQSTGNWAGDAAALRQHLTDYLGAAGTNVELVVTENNSDAGAQGRQSTSLVNGLYYADSLGRLFQTEFRGFLWWDFRNGTDRNGYFGDTVYGWRDYGDLGMVNGLQTRHPTFYAAKLAGRFARPGDQVLHAASDYPWVSAYAVRRANGAVSLLVVNKSLTADLDVRIAVAGFTPSATAATLSYGVPNDEAARTNGPAASRDLTAGLVTDAGPGFTRRFPRLSMTVLTLAPSPPRLSVTPAEPGQLVVRLHGQPGVRYDLEQSPDPGLWSVASTHVLTGETLEETRPAAGPQTYWRAVWRP